jgi:hypothetical protein
MRQLGGRVVVVTGAASGIGRGLADAFVAAGIPSGYEPLDLGQPGLIRAVTIDPTRRDQPSRLPPGPRHP